MKYSLKQPANKLIFNSFLLLMICCAFSSCFEPDSIKAQNAAAKKNIDTLPAVIAQPEYDSLQLTNTQSITAAEGTKSVIFNTAGTKLYAMNLEGMSVYEFDASTKKNNKRVFI